MLPVAIHSYLHLLQILLTICLISQNTINTLGRLSATVFLWCRSYAHSPEPHFLLGYLGSTSRLGSFSVVNFEHVYPPLTSHHLCLFLHSSLRTRRTRNFKHFATSPLRRPRLVSWEAYILSALHPINPSNCFFFFLGGGLKIAPKL